MNDVVAQFLASQAYYQCLLLVSVDIARLDAVSRELQATYRLPQLSVGAELSYALLEEVHQKRPRAAQRWLSCRLNEMAPGPIVCTQIDLLFEPSLRLDPLAILRDASRTTKIIAAWPGSYVAGILSYAVPEHSHHHTWRNPDVTVLVL